MRIIKPLRLGLLTKTVPHNGGGLFVVSTFTLFDLLDPTDILAETGLWPMAAKELPKGAIFDPAYPKPTAEFLIAGRAMSRESVPAMQVGVSVGDKARTLSVFGDRSWQPGVEGPVFSQPDPFTDMPLTPDRAFGGEGYAANPAGRGAVAADLYGHAEGIPLPNVELAGSEIHAISDVPEPALVGPIPMDDPARLRLMGTYDSGWTQTKMPEWPDDFDPRYYLSAPQEQRFDGFLTGTEPIRVIGMSVDAPDVQSCLPGVRARAFVTVKGAAGTLHEIQMRTDTVWVFGSELKGVVVNRGIAEIASRDGNEIESVMVAYEWLKDEPRPATHYHEVYALRTDPEEGHKYLLADGQLSPQEAPEELERREQARLADAQARMAKWDANRKWRLERHFADNGLPASLVPVTDDPEMKPFILPTKEDVARGDVDFARLISDAEDLRVEAELKANMARAEVYGFNRQLEVPSSGAPTASLERMEQLGEGNGGGPGFLPGFDDLLPHSELDRILEAFEQVAPEERHDVLSTDPQADFEAARDRFLKTEQSGLLAPAKSLLETLPPSEGPPDLPDEQVNSETPVLDEILENYLSKAFPELDVETGASRADGLRAALSPDRSAMETMEDRQAAVQQQLLDAEATAEDALVTARREAAEPIAPLKPIGPEAAGLFGNFIRAHISGGGALAGRDLAGADLGDLDLAGANLAGAFLEACRLQNARLQRAQAEDAVFTGGDLTGADLSAAELGRANFSKVIARGASFRNARFSGSTVVAADFTDCDFSGAMLDGCTFVDCQFANVSLSSAHLRDCAFLKSDLTGLKVDRVQLEKTSFLSCQLDRSDWSKSSLKKSSFARVGFREANLAGAVLAECGWFGQTDMEGANFTHVQAVKCGFQEARLAKSAFHRAVFNECNFASAILSGADMRLASFKGSLFAFAEICEADLFGANLLETSLHGADLGRSSFRAANFYLADLSDAKVAFADFTASNLELSNKEAKV